MSETVVSGMRPTGKLHLGNYFGALRTWLELQDEEECFFFVADWHALTTGYKETDKLRRNSLEVAIDWLAAGLDPDKCVLFRQSDIPQHAELHILMEMITPESWLKRNPTYKAAQKEMEGEKVSNVGFLSYPVLQTADVMAYEGTRVPVGEDQKPHLEIGRRIVRRLNHLYGTDFPEMNALIREVPNLLGLDGRKMSKSYNNCIFLSDEPAVRKDKVMKFKTDCGSQPGDEVPDEGPIANLFTMLELFGRGDWAEEYRQDYRKGKIQYGYMKQDLGEAMNDYFSEFDSRRRQLEQNLDEVREMLQSGAEEARRRAAGVLDRVKEGMNLT